MKITNLRIEHRVAGIPCIILVHEAVVQPSDPWADNDVDYYGWAETDYEILDRRGRPAPWLERKASKLDELSIEHAINSRLLG